jgi:hypothetical protein
MLPKRKKKDIFICTYCKNAAQYFCYPYMTEREAEKTSCARKQEEQQKIQRNTQA